MITWKFITRQKWKQKYFQCHERCNINSEKKIKLLEKREFPNEKETSLPSTSLYILNIHFLLASHALRPKHMSLWWKIDVFWLTKKALKNCFSSIFWNFNQSRAWKKLQSYTWIVLNFYLINFERHDDISVWKSFIFSKRSFLMLQRTHEDTIEAFFPSSS